MREKAGRLWYDFRDSMIFTLASILLVGTALLLEFRYNYVEMAIGRYLAWHNDSRETSGTIWETVTVSEDVRSQLDKLVEDRREENQLSQPVGSLNQLIEQVFFKEKLIMTRDQFIETYNRMPLYHSAMIIGQVEMLELIARHSEWQRTMMVFEDGDLKFFLIDGLNNVLEELTLGSEYVNYFLRERETRSLGLDSFPGFRGSQYPADVFYDAWAMLNPAERNGIPLSNSELIDWRYRLQRVGVNHRSLVGERMEIGFELSGDEGITTVRILARSVSALTLLDQMNIVSGGGPVSPERRDETGPTRDPDIPAGLY